MHYLRDTNGLKKPLCVHVGMHDVHILCRTPHDLAASPLERRLRNANAIPLRPYKVFSGI